MGGVGVRVTSIPILPQFQVDYWEGLCTKTWYQVFKSGDVLIHYLLGAQPPLIHSVLLESPYKLSKHSPDPNFSQEVVFGNVFGKGPWNAMLEAEKNDVNVTWIQLLK